MTGKLMASVRNAIIAFAPVALALGITANGQTPTSTKNFSPHNNDATTVKSDADEIIPSPTANDDAQRNSKKTNDLSIVLTVGKNTVKDLPRLASEIRDKLSGKIDHVKFYAEYEPDYPDVIGVEAYLPGGHPFSVNNEDVFLYKEFKLVYEELENTYKYYLQRIQTQAASVDGARLEKD